MVKTYQFNVNIGVKLLELKIILLATDIYLKLVPIMLGEGVEVYFFLFKSNKS